MTPAERQQLKRDRRKAGLVRLELWIPKGTKPILNWQPIETAPQEEGARFLVAIDGEVYVGFNVWEEDGRQVICVEDYRRAQAQWWLPLDVLPELPKDTTSP